MYIRNIGASKKVPLRRTSIRYCKAYKSKPTDMTDHNEKCPECKEDYSESGKQTPRLVQLKRKNKRTLGVYFTHTQTQITGVWIDFVIFHVPYHPTNQTNVCLVCWVIRYTKITKSIQTPVDTNTDTNIAKSWSWIRT